MQKWLIILTGFFLGSSFCFAQQKINGFVKDQDSFPIPGAQVYLKSNPKEKATIGFEGYFSINSEQQWDTLIISASSFNGKQIPLKTISDKENLIVILTPKPQSLQEVILVAQDPISKRFAVDKITEMDIYFNPVSKNDPLQSIKILPVSTNTNETADPVLRGGSADRSRVYVNGAPILNPVRNSDNDGLTNFSLFNTAIIDQQYVYASNPPLTFGNSSAGIVEIETAKKIANQDLRFSIALSSAGFMFNKKIGEKSFLQLYANRDFSYGFKVINKSALPDLNSFSSQDFGLNFRIALNSHFSLNSFSYFVNEHYKNRQHLWNYSGKSKAQQKRFFTINNLDYRKNRSFIRLSTLYDFADEKYNFGNIDSANLNHTYYVSLSHKYQWFSNFSFQYGLDIFSSTNTYNESIPNYFYAIAPDHPTHQKEEKINFNYTEAYLYLNYKFDNQMGFTGAVRKNLLKKAQINDFWSYQFSTYYRLDSDQKLILGVGHYNSYSVPNHFIHQVFSLNSKQIALDYRMAKKDFEISAAVYFKEDKGSLNLSELEQFDRITSSGMELSLNYHPHRFLTLGLSNTFLYQKAFIADERLTTQNNLKYHLKSQVSYNNPEIFMASLALITHPGNHFTPVLEADFNPELEIYQPTFGKVNSNTLHSYFRFDFTINKVFDIHGNALITYLTVNNLLNTQNQAYRYYTEDYAHSSVEPYQQRTIYFGIQYRLNI